MTGDSATIAVIFRDQLGLLFSTGFPHGLLDPIGQELMVSAGQYRGIEQQCCAENQHQNRKSVIHDTPLSRFPSAFYEVFLIPHKEGVDRPDLAPEVGVAADILVIDRLHLRFCADAVVQ